MPAPGMGFSTPGFFQAGLGSAGFFAPNNQRSADQRSSQAQLGALGGGAAANFLTSTAPGAIGTGVMLGGAAAPLFRGIGTSMGRPGMVGFARALDAIDPFTYVMKAGGAGFRAGSWAAGRQVGAGMLSAGARGVMGGLVGGAMGVTGVGAIMGAGAFAASSYLSNMRDGQQAYQDTKMLLAQRSGSMFGRQVDPTNGMAVGMQQQFRSAARSLGTDSGTVREITRYLDDQGYFKSVSGTKEFKEKFDKALSTIKTIAKEMQTSIEDATQTFSQIRQQGFYQAADVGAQALKQGALAAATGRDPSQVAAMGAYGAQTARRYGMRGRFGAEFMQNVQASVDLGMRNGSISEEAVMEAGGPEAVAARLGQAQMRFLKGARGRMMMANAMGSGSEMDVGRLTSVVGGNSSLEQLVTRAVNRGLGTLQATGGREAQENFMQYAGMAMVNSARAERGQLGMSTDRKGLIRGLMHQGLGREEAGLLLDQSLNMGNVLREQRNESMRMQQEAEFDRVAKQYSIIARTKGAWKDNISDPARYMGARVGEEMDQQAASWGSWWSGRNEVSMGGTSQGYLRRGAMFEGPRGAGTARSRALFAAPSMNERFLDEYSDYAVTGNQAMVDSVMGGGSYFSQNSDLMSVQGRVYDKSGREYSQVSGNQFAPKNVADLDFQARFGRNSRDVSGQAAAGLRNLSTTHRLDDVVARSRTTDMSMSGPFGLGTMFGFGGPSARDTATWDYVNALEDDPLKAGLPSTPEAYSRLPGEEKAQYEGAISRALRGTAHGKEYDKLGVGRKTAYRTDSAAARKAYGEEFDKLASAWGSPVAGNFYGNTADELKLATEKSGVQREAFGKAMEVALSENLDQDAMEKALKGLGASGMTGQALTQAQQLVGHYSSLTGDARTKARAGAARLFDVGASLEYQRLTDQSKSITKNAYQRWVEGSGDPMIDREFGAAGDAVRALGKASSGGTREEYVAAWEGVLKQVAAGGISAEEKKSLFDISGGQLGTLGMASDINSVIDEKTRAAKLKEFGYSDQDIAAAMGKSADQVVGDLMARGDFSPAMYDNGTGTGKGGRTTVEGMESDVWKRQTEFVVAVDAFLTAFKSTGVGKEMQMDTYGDEVVGANTVLK